MGRPNKDEPEPAVMANGVSKIKKESDDTTARQQIEVSKGGIADSKTLKTEQAGNYDNSTAATMAAPSGSQAIVDFSVTITTTTNVDSNEHLTLDIDTRVPYRHGWPLLPVLPVTIIRKNIPKKLLSPSPHLTTFRTLLDNHAVLVHALEIAHRLHRNSPATPIGKATLTLCIHSDTANNATWAPAIRALREYIQTQDLTLSVEIIDHRIVAGMFTLPILAYDPLTAWIKKRQHGVATLLNECGEEWSSLDFFYRGLSKKRGECKATLLVGVPHPNRKVWWEKVLPRIRERVGVRLEVEMCWREVRKY